jgi:hypothetical protein
MFLEEQDKNPDRVKEHPAILDQFFWLAVRKQWPEVAKATVSWISNPESNTQYNKALASLMSQPDMKPNPDIVEIFCKLGANPFVLSADLKQSLFALAIHSKQNTLVKIYLESGKQKSADVKMVAQGIARLLDETPENLYFLATLPDEKTKVRDAKNIVFKMLNEAKTIDQVLKIQSVLNRLSNDGGELSFLRGNNHHHSLGIMWEDKPARATWFTIMQHAKEKIIQIAKSNPDNVPPFDSEEHLLILNFLSKKTVRQLFSSAIKEPELYLKIVKHKQPLLRSLVA